MQNETTEYIVKRCRVSGGNLPKDFTVFVNLKILVDITRSQQLDCMGSSLIIDWQKVREYMKPDELRKLAAEEYVELKASEILARKAKKVAMTPEEVVDEVLAGRLTISPEKATALIKQLEAKAKK